MSPFTVREAEVEDAEALSYLIHSVAQYFLVDPSGEGAEGFFDTVSVPAMARLLADPAYDFLVGEVGSELAGAVAIRHHRHLYNLYVAQKFHRRGFGKRLWLAARERALAERAPGAGTGDAFTVNASPYAIAIYERFGFVATGPRVETEGIAFIPMKLELESWPDLRFG